MNAKHGQLSKQNFWMQALQLKVQKLKTEKLKAEHLNSITDKEARHKQALLDKEAEHQDQLKEKEFAAQVEKERIETENNHYEALTQKMIEQKHQASEKA